MKDTPWEQEKGKKKRLVRSKLKVLVNYKTHESLVTP